MNTSMLSFNGGEVSPYLRHRIDFEKTPSSAAQMRNFLPMPYGGVIKRPGLQQLATLVTAGENSRMLPFVASDGTKYLLHFTPDVLKIYGIDGTLKDTLDFMAGYEWPESHDWENSIRDLHLIQVNDVAFITHPGVFPLKLSRLGDANWTLEFIPFKRPPLKDENTDLTKTFTVASDPVADVWASGASYTAGNKVFTDSEWICTLAHTATPANKPGTGTIWRSYWRQMFYAAGESVTILSKDLRAAAWQRLTTPSLIPNTVLTRTAAAGELYLVGDNGLQLPTAYSSTPGWEQTWLDANDTADYYSTTTSSTCRVPAYVYAASGNIYYATGSCISYAGSIYRALVTGGSPTPANIIPGDTSGWEGYYSLFIEDYEVASHTWQVSYALDDQVSYAGKIYQCILAHNAADDREPEVGAAWATYWTLVSTMLPEFAMGDFSPGQYFMISPNRPETDFQIELPAHASSTSGQIVIQGAWNFFTFGTWRGTFNLQRSINGGTTWETIQSWEGKGDRNISASGTQDDPAIFRLIFTKSGTGANSPRGLLVPEKASVKGYALMDTYVGPNAMTGTALTPLMSGNTPRWAYGAFNESDGYPRALALHESRLVFAGTYSQPITLWLSASDDLDNFETGTDADNGIAATLAANAATPIRWLASARRLFVGTLMNEWVCGSDTSDTPLTPESFVARQHTANGSCSQQPIMHSGGLLFLTRKGTRLRDYGYSFERDSYDGADVSRLAEHLTAGGISNMAWQQTREPGLWAVTRAGDLLHFAYSRADNIMAWSQHDTTGGTFLDVVTFPSDAGDDDVFFVVNRAGDTFLERFPAGWQAAYEAGEGYLCQDPDDTPITSILQSLPIDSGAQDGTTQGRRKRPHKFVLSLYNSGGGKVWNRNQAAAQTIAGTDPLTSAWIDVIPDAGHLDDCQLNILHEEAVPFILRSACIRWMLHER